jgi:hypothetical protein
MDKTEQFNLRISKSILADLEFIERSTGVSKSDWVRIYIAESVKKAKDEHMEKLERNFMMGRVSEADFKKTAGCSPEEALAKRKEVFQKKILELAASEARKEFSRNALKEMGKQSRNP